MSDDQDTKPPTSAQRRYLSQSITSLFVALDEIHQDMATQGDVSDPSRQALMSELCTVIVQLRQWRDRDIGWGDATPYEGGPEQLLNILLEGSEEYDTPRGQRNAPPDPVPKPAEVPTARLYQSALDITDIANELGLTSPVDESKERVDSDFV